MAAAFVVAAIAVISMAWQVIQQITMILIRPILNGINSDDPQVPIPPADLADMVERNIAGQSWAEGEASKSGLSPNDFDLLVQNTGEPYGVIDGLRLLRRGAISEDEFTKVLYYSRVRNEFLPDVLQLQWDTMSPSDAIECALKEVLDPTTAANLFSQGGGLPSQFDTLLSATGDAIGVAEALRLYNHGYLTAQDVQSVMAHSRINPEFYDMAMNLRFQFLPIYQLVNTLKAGACTPEQFATWAAGIGYPADQIAALTTYASGQKTAAHKNLTEAQVTEMLQVGIVTEDQAIADFQTLGYDAGEAAAIIALANQKREVSMANAVVSQVRKGYLMNRITAEQAQQFLAGINVGADVISYYLAIWEVEAQTEVKTLSAAEIGDMVKRGYVESDWGVQRWVQMGYSEDDADLLLAYYSGVAPPDSPAAIAAQTSAATSPLGTTGA